LFDEGEEDVAAVAAAVAEEFNMVKELACQD
jgi:hypothetical protein